VVGAKFIKRKQKNIYISTYLISGYATAYKR
jgi:hypothetical protein